MAIRISVVSRDAVFWNYIHHSKKKFDKYIGKIEDKNLVQFEHICESLGLRFLSLIDPYDHMVLNNNQMSRATLELRELEKAAPEIARTMEPIKQAINIANQKNDLYVKFESD